MRDNRHHYPSSTQIVQLLASALLLLTSCSPEQLPATDQSMSASTTVSGFALYAEHSLRLGSRDSVVGGDLGVRTANAPGSASQLQLGRNSSVDGQHRVLSPSTSLEHGAQVGDVQTNALRNNGGSLHSLSPFSAATMPALPLALASPTGSRAVTVALLRGTILAPGSYGELKVYGTLILRPGSYSFTSIVLGDRAQLLAQSGGTEVRVQGSFTTGRWVIVSPLSDRDNENILLRDDRQDDSVLWTAALLWERRDDASQLRLAISGRDGANYAPAATLGDDGRFTALLAVPHGTVTIGERTIATGAFAGFDIIISNDTKVAFSKGFPSADAGQQGQQHLKGYFSVQPDPSIAPLAGPVPAETSLSLSFSLPVRDPQGLKAFLKQVSDPKEPNFRKHLTQAQFAATYGATAADYQSLKDWATSHGMTITDTYSNNLLLTVSATAAQFEQALYANLDFRLRQDGSRFVAVDREPSLDLTVPLLQISGLNNYFLPEVAGGTGGGGGATGTYRAADLRNAYLGVQSPCQTLNGSGQVVGIIAFDIYAQSDIDGYDALQSPPLSSTNVRIATTDFVGTPTLGSNQEATADVELVQAMAPGAQILLFQGSKALTDNVDSLLNKMATSTPKLTIMSSSLKFAGGSVAQQAFDQMAAQGVTILSASGDTGDIGDPYGNRDLDNHTLVGGTLLQTFDLSGPTYPNPYYISENTWNKATSPGLPFVTGGGIMDGNNLDGKCQCWPYQFCCHGGGVSIPDYQVGVSMATNGGSTTWRNYPDVAMVAANVEIFFQGATPFSGTSASAPLWAGFMALVNQRSMQNGMGLSGFINPALYSIGKTRGMPNDLYASCFHDVFDGFSNANGYGSGFTSVAGYDLTTGWGSPSCQLLNQLSFTTQGTPNQPYSQIEFTIVTGDDDLRGNNNGCGTGASADVLLSDGRSFTVPLHDKDSIAGFDSGVSHTLTPPIAILTPPLNPPLSAINGIAGVTINIQEHYNFSCTADNWDIRSLGVRLINPPGRMIDGTCQLKLMGNSTLQDSSTGLVRLSETAGGSGVGPSVTFLTGTGSGCL